MQKPQPGRWASGQTLVCGNRWGSSSTQHHQVCVEEVGPALMQWQNARPAEVELCHSSPALTGIGSAGILAGAGQQSRAVRSLQARQVRSAMYHLTT